MYTVWCLREGKVKGIKSTQWHRLAKTPDTFSAMCFFLPLFLSFFICTCKVSNADNAPMNVVLCTMGFENALKVGDWYEH